MTWQNSGELVTTKSWVEPGDKARRNWTLACCEVKVHFRAVKFSQFLFCMQNDHTKFTKICTIRKFSTIRLGQQPSRLHHLEFQHWALLAHTYAPCHQALLQATLFYQFFLLLALPLWLSASSPPPSIFPLNKCTLLSPMSCVTFNFSLLQLHYRFQRHNYRPIWALTSGMKLFGYLSCCFRSQMANAD